MDRKPIERRLQKRNCQTVVDSSFCYKGPCISIEHKIRKRIILTFTSSITQLEKPDFYLHGEVCWCTSRALTESILIIDSKNIIFRLAQIQVSATGALKFNTPIEHKVRNVIILTFTFFSITQLEKLAFYVHGLSSYAWTRHRQKVYWP